MVPIIEAKEADEGLAALLLLMLLFLLILLLLLLLLLCQGPLKVDGGATKCSIMGIHPVALTNEFQMPFKRQLAICPFRFNLIKQPVATTTTFHHVLKTALSH